SRPSFLDGRDAHPTNLWKLFNSHSLLILLQDVSFNRLSSMRRGFQPPAGCVTKQTNFQSVSGRSNLREMCDRIFGLWPIDFERNVRSSNKLFTNK
ncbi:hypothetical protein QUA08_31340, partial [Microcoleus sp. T3B2]